MANPRLPEKSQTEMFDSNVNELRKKGFNILEIARQMKLHHQIISNVLKGVYEVKGPQGIKNKPSKWDWKKIDTERSVKLPSLIRELRKKGISITKSVIAKELKLKDVSLRNLPNVKRGIKLLKN
jgi:lambda repressor-like predicted transcriptional regulator